VKRIYLYRLSPEVSQALKKAFRRFHIHSEEVADTAWRSTKGISPRKDALILCSVESAEELLYTEPDLPVVAILSQGDPPPLFLLEQGLKAYLRYPAPQKELLDLIAQLTGQPPLEEEEE
jgi:hypothetical protein